MSKKLTINEWIKHQGVGRVAAILGVTEDAVRYWLRGQSLPRTEQMAQIKNVSRGRVSLERTILEHHK